MYLRESRLHCGLLDSRAAVFLEHACSKRSSRTLVELQQLSTPSISFRQCRGQRGVIAPAADRQPAAGRRTYTGAKWTAMPPHHAVEHADHCSDEYGAAAAARGWSLTPAPLLVEDSQLSVARCARLEAFMCVQENVPLICASSSQTAHSQNHHGRSELGEAYHSSGRLHS